MVEKEFGKNSYFYLMTYDENAETFNTTYHRNPRNVTGVMSQSLVIVLPVTSYQPKTTPDTQ